MSRPFALMVKPIGAVCNLACSYCYYLNNEVSSRKPMSFEHLEKIIASYLTSSPGFLFAILFIYMRLSVSLYISSKVISLSLV